MKGARLKDVKRRGERHRGRDPGEKIETRATVVVEWQRVEGKGERKKMVEKGGRPVVIKYEEETRRGQEEDERRGGGVERRVRCR